MLYWVDIAERQIRRANFVTGTVQIWAMPSEPGCIAPARSGGASSGLVIALRDGIYRAHEWGGALQRLVPAAHDISTSRFNDGKADPLGRFWAGTIYEPRTAPDAVLYCLDCRDGKAPVLERKAGGATVANGLVWSPDAATLYWADTTQHLIRAWTWNASNNVLGNERVFARFPPKPPGWSPGMPGYGGRPDGASVDVEGNLYVAMYEGGRLLKLSPAGEVLEEIPVPCPCPTMPCFGGKDGKTLYLTSVREGRPAQELQAWPQSGCVFAMQVDVPGLPVNFFQD